MDEVLLVSVAELLWRVVFYFGEDDGGEGGGAGGGGGGVFGEAGGAVGDAGAVEGSLVAILALTEDLWSLLEEGRC